MFGDSTGLSCHTATLATCRSNFSDAPSHTLTMLVFLQMAALSRWVKGFWISPDSFSASVESKVRRHGDVLVLSMLALRAVMQCLSQAHCVALRQHRDMRPLSLEVSWCHWLPCLRLFSAVEPWSSVPYCACSTMLPMLSKHFFHDKLSTRVKRVAGLVTLACGFHRHDRTPPIDCSVTHEASGQWLLGRMCPSAPESIKM